MRKTTSVLVTALLALPGTLIAQDLERTVNGTDRGTIRLSYATRPGVCGNEDNIRLDSRHRVHRGRLLLPAAPATLLV